MTIFEIEVLVRRGESDSLEFKKNTGQLTRAAETLRAFLNGHGGIVLVGASRDKKIAGQIAQSPRPDVPTRTRPHCPSGV